MKFKNESNKNINKFRIKDLLSSFGESFKQYSTMINDEVKKPKEEQKKDLTALILTLIIVAFIIFIVWKVPFLHNIIFP